MSKTLTQKLKRKAIREGKHDFTRSRGGQELAIQTFTRKNKTKKESLERAYRKHRKVASM